MDLGMFYSVQNVDLFVILMKREIVHFSIYVQSLGNFEIGAYLISWKMSQGFYFIRLIENYTCLTLYVSFVIFHDFICFQLFCLDI